MSPNNISIILLTTILNAPQMKTTSDNNGTTPLTIQAWQKSKSEQSSITTKPENSSFNDIGIGSQLTSENTIHVQEDLLFEIIEMVTPPTTGSRTLSPDTSLFEKIIEKQPLDTPLSLSVDILFEILDQDLLTVPQTSKQHHEKTTHCQQAVDNAFYTHFQVESLSQTTEENKMQQLSQYNHQSKTDKTSSHTLIRPYTPAHNDYPILKHQDSQGHPIEPRSLLLQRRQSKQTKTRL